MVIYAFEKLRIIFSVIIFHFKETVSNINTKSSSHCLPPAYVVFFHFLFLFSLSFQGSGVCFQSFIPPKQTTPNPLFHHFSFYHRFWNLLLFYSVSFKLWMGKHPFVRWGCAARASGAVRGRGCDVDSDLQDCGCLKQFPPRAGGGGQSCHESPAVLGNSDCLGALCMLEVLVALGCPEASSTAQAMAQAWGWGAHASSPRCSQPLPPCLSRHSRSQ